MKAIGFTEHLPIQDKNSLIEFSQPMPEVKEHDLLVKISATSVNPVDVGVRKSGYQNLANPKVIGWDAVGVVVDTGKEVTLFHNGEKVFYAGSFIRPGSNSEYQLVDERIVGHAPKTLSDAEIAAMPLTSLTAWEALFEQLEISPYNKEKNHQNTILIINGAGGVGSIATQLAHWVGLKTIATASRAETISWVRQNNADFTVNHRKNLVDEVHKLGFKYVDYILELNDLDGHWDEMAQLIKPSGRITSITENHRPIDIKKLTKKRATFSWEWMYSKSFYQTPDMITQHKILENISQLLDNKTIHSTLTKTLSPINVDNLKKAHQLVETNHMIGKVVISNQK
ncbi:zinc-binding alcohol dehydrogenase family protein [Companilactobacillus bobalius]|uniref:Zinc-type alcohol dehydrogenase-like protein n=2 Tax=Companilactobacillus bobalius TaxID=2801451 RepID=A0A202FEB8_9LACO|nr:zinc-binding alcohol dehydrogenase family protein [Companilactobacillus bobalius]KAE9557109.1 alcohol dehydrogenase [Companilactobacillus bobalius]KRK82035.1 alcohol dehydrogenase, zinc-binding protein [Companilactobacillus bobalius DSM 19674]OVE98772.1 Alcohol dehydrogenase [Companilactobacillus bobalius]GEO57946.1 NADPH:quinone reductase [Companilactobacillus paralimentarius]